MKCLSHQRAKFALSHILGKEDKRHRAKRQIVTGVHAVPNSRCKQSHSRAQRLEREAPIDVGREPKLHSHIPIPQADAEVGFLGVKLVNVVDGFEIDDVGMISFPVTSPQLV